MGKGILNTTIFFDESSDKNIKSGYVTITASESITVDEITAIVFLEKRGRMASEKIHVVSLNLESKKKLYREEAYKIPFSLSLPDDILESYKGVNVDFSYKLEIQVFVSEDDLDKLEQGIFSKFKSFITSDDSLRFSEYFDVKNKEGAYKVKTAKTILKLDGNNFIKFGVLLFVVLGFAFFIEELNLFYFLMGIASVIALVFITTNYIKNILGEVSMEIRDDDEVFLCKIKKTRNFNLTNQKCFYEIIERVIDDRGTTSSTYTERLYASEVKELRKFSRTSDLQFKYPDVAGLYSFNSNNAAVLWKMNVEGKFFGVKLNYQCDFLVEKV